MHNNCLLASGQSWQRGPTRSRHLSDTTLHIRQRLVPRALFECENSVSSRGGVWDEDGVIREGVLYFAARHELSAQPPSVRSLFRANSSSHSALRNQSRQSASSLTSTDSTVGGSDEGTTQDVASRLNFFVIGIGVRIL